MSDVPTAPDWWQASDAKWYPPELHPTYRPPAPPPPPPPPPIAPAGPPVAPPPFPSPAYQSPPQQPPTFGAVSTYGVPVQPPGPDAPSGSAWRKPWVLIAGVAVSVLLILLVVGLLVDDDDDQAVTGADTTTSDPAPTSTEAATPTPAPEADTATPEPDTGTGTGIEPTPAVGKPTPTPESETTSGGDTCRFVELDSFDDIQIQIEFTSRLTTTTDVEVDYVLRDGDVRIGEGTSFIVKVDPGEVIQIDQDTLTDVPSGVDAPTIGCEITDISESLITSFSIPPTAADTCTYLGVDSFGDMQVQLEFTSPLTTSATLVIDYVLREGNRRFFAGQAFTEAIAPNEASRFDEDTLTDAPAGLDTSAVTCAIVGFTEF